MAEITAVMVRQLRERSGLPMMDCKNALTEAGGDEEKAMELLRKRGAIAAEKKAGRATGEGRIGAFIDTGEGVGALVEVLCETAPVANNPDFRALAEKVARHAALAGEARAESIGNEKFIDDASVTVTDVLHDTLNRLRENILIGRVIRRTGPRPAAYIHHTGKIGVLLVTEGADDAELLNDVCMHIAFTQPQAIRREQMPGDEVAKEEAINREQIVASGKPENMVEKILTGKMNRWFSERVLLEQPFVKDDKQTVGALLDKAGIKVLDYVRLQVGVQ